MKRILMMLALLLPGAWKGLAQVSSDYPKYVMEGGRSLVVMTVEQAQKLDNDAELAIMFKQLQPGADSLREAYISVINSYGKQVAVLELKISELEGLVSTQKEKIGNLNSQIGNYKADLIAADLQSKDKDQQIANLKKEVKRQKIQKIIGYAVGAVAVVAAVALSL